MFSFAYYLITFYNCNSIAQKLIEIYWIQITLYLGFKDNEDKVIFSFFSQQYFQATKGRILYLMNDSKVPYIINFHISEFLARLISIFTLIKKSIV